MDHIAMQMLMPQEASGSNQRHIKSGREWLLIRQAGRKDARLGDNCGKDCFDSQLTAITAKLMEAALPPSRWECGSSLDLQRKSAQGQ